MKAIKTSLPLILALFLAGLPGCGLFNTVYGSGIVTTVTSNLDSFTRVALAGACTGAVSRAAYSITVRIDDNLARYLRIVRDGDTLTVDLEPGRNYADFTFAVDVTLPDLEAVSVSDAGAAAVSGFTSLDNLTLEASNASGLTLSGLQATVASVTARDASRVTGSLDSRSCGVEASDASSVSLSGNAANLSLSVQDASHAGLAALSAGDVGAWVGNASSAEVRSSGALSGSVTDSSSLRYAGSPTSVTVTRDVSSSVGPM
jgi:hypothetical protein